jgi:methyl-accepting chemotaxis protein
MNTLQDFQIVITRILTALAGLHVGIIGITAWALGKPVGPVTGIALLLAAAPLVTTLLKRPLQSTFFALAIALVGQTSLFVYAFAGHPWQVEAHFYYFALLAMLAGLCDWKILLAGAALIAVHHLTLNTLLPAAIYPGGTDYARVVFHAVVVVVETAMLVGIGLVIRSAFAQAEQAHAEAVSAAAELREVAERREDALTSSRMQADQLKGTIADFEREISELTGVLQSAAQTLETDAVSLTQAASHANAQSVTAAAASRATAEKVSSAADAGDELAQTISEVGSNAAQSSQLAANAVIETQRTNATIDELAAVANEIGNVTELISAIAGQTNLLALNATIEAARAGESGRGFAVVAQEVKALAGQTATATQEIERRIQAMQNATGRSVEAIQAISGTIRELDRFSALIADAVEQQAMAAREIAGSATAAASSVQQVNGAILEIDKVAAGTSNAAGRLSAAAHSIGAQTEKIQARVRTFTDRIRTARA